MQTVCRLILESATSQYAKRVLLQSASMLVVSTSVLRCVYERFCQMQVPHLLWSITTRGEGSASCIRGSFENLFHHTRF